MLEHIFVPGRMLVGCVATFLGVLWISGQGISGQAPKPGAGPAAPAVITSAEAEKTFDLLYDAYFDPQKR